MSEKSPVLILHCCQKCGNPYLRNFEDKPEEKRAYFAQQPYARLCTDIQVGGICVLAIAEPPSLPESDELGRLAYDAFWKVTNTPAHIAWEDLINEEQARWAFAATAVARVVLAHSGQVSINEARSSVGLPPEKLEGI